MEVKGNGSQMLEKWKESLNSNDIGSAQQLQWNSEIVKHNRNPDETGKIIKNSPQKSNIEMSPHHRPYKTRLINSLQRKDSDRSEPAHFNNEPDLRPVSLKKKFESTAPSPRRRHVDP